MTMKMKLPLPVAPQKKNLHAQASVNLNKKLDAASKGFRAALAKQDYEAAYAQILAAFKLVPTHAPILMDMAYTELKLQRYEKAYQRYLKAIEYSQGKVDPNIYDGLTETCHFLTKTEEMKKYGHLALNAKKQQVAHQPKQPIPLLRPQFHPDRPQQNIIAYSLFGALPRYCETSIINVDLAKEIYPEWTCRFYVDDSVPQHIQQRLKAKGAQVIQVNDAQKAVSGLFWRFWVMNDPTVNCFLVRDADSLVSYRERAAVDEWLASDKWFHCMHDFYSHTELVLAGMWGGFNGVFQDLAQDIQDYVASGNYLSKRVADQHYLRNQIWPTLSQSVMIHDSQGFDPEGLLFPTAKQSKAYEDLSQFHVGMNEGSSEVLADVNIPDVSVVDWVLRDEQGNDMCRYRSQVLPNRKIEVELPRSYAQKLEAKTYTLHIYATENID